MITDKEFIIYNFSHFTQKCFRLAPKYYIRVILKQSQITDISIALTFSYNIIWQNWIIQGYFFWGIVVLKINESIGSSIALCMVYSSIIYLENNVANDHFNFQAGSHNQLVILLTIGKVSSVLMLAIFLGLKHVYQWICRKDM